MEANKLAEIETAQQTLDQDPDWLQSTVYQPEWGPSYWTKWATIAFALERLGVAKGAKVLDVGCGAGFTTLLLSESGWRPTGMDLAPARVAMGRARAQRAGIEAEWAVGDMEDFALGRDFDAILVYDALHHTQRRRQRTVLANIAGHLRPGGWVLFGEPSLLHYFSPSARRASRESGWIERGVGVRHLKRDCAAAGLEDFRRFHEPSVPYARSLPGLVSQSAQLALSVALFAPQHSIWLAARRPSG